MFKLPTRPVSGPGGFWSRIDTPSVTRPPIGGRELRSASVQPWLLPLKRRPRSAQPRTAQLHHAPGSARSIARAASLTASLSRSVSGLTRSVGPASVTPARGRPPGPSTGAATPLTPGSSSPWVTAQPRSRAPPRARGERSRRRRRRRPAPAPPPAVGRKASSTFPEAPRYMGATRQRPSDSRTVRGGSTESSPMAIRPGRGREQHGLVVLARELAHDPARGLEQRRGQPVLDPSRQLQYPQPEPQLSVVALDQPVALELVDQPVGGAGRELGPPGKLGRSRAARPPPPARTAWRASGRARGYRPRAACSRRLDAAVVLGGRDARSLVGLERVALAGVGRHARRRARRWRPDRPAAGRPAPSPSRRPGGERIRARTHRPRACPGPSGLRPRRSTAWAPQISSCATIRYPSETSSEVLRTDSGAMLAWSSTPSAS